MLLTLRRFVAIETVQFSHLSIDAILLTEATTIVQLKQFEILALLTLELM